MKRAEAFAWIQTRILRGQVRFSRAELASALSSGDGKGTYQFPVGAAGEILRELRLPVGKPGRKTEDEAF